MAYRLDDQIGPLLRQAYQYACSNLSAFLVGYDLTPIQYSTLVRLWEFGPVSQNKLGRLLDIKSGNMHGVARRLRDRGLVESQTDARYRRVLLLKLTNNGKDLVESVMPLSKQATAKTLSPLDVGEQKQLFALLHRIITD
jgi:DNA-binding MarR family transcriptional regulator